MLESFYKKKTVNWTAEYPALVESIKINSFKLTIERSQKKL